MNRKLVSIGCLSISLLTLVGIFGGAAFYVQWIGQVVLDAYASDWTSEFLIAHLRSNDNQWPTNWEDLRDEYDKLADPNHYPFTFVALQDRVVLDWKVDTLSLATADPPQIFFRLKSGRQASYGGDPNERIREYFANRSLNEDKREP